MRFASIVIALVALCVLGTGADAQTPFIAAYFDLDFTEETTVCSPGFGQVHFAGVNWNVFVTGVQFAVVYPPAMTWEADTNLQPVSAGTTPTGLAMGYATPQNGFFPVYICSSVFRWNCQVDCSDVVGGPDQPLLVVPHPLLGPVGVTDFPDFNLHTGVGLTAVICPVTVPTEETTWGRVKALYSN
jgi:hypothetical protein